MSIISVSKAIVVALAGALVVPTTAQAASSKADDAKHERQLGKLQGQHEKGTPQPLTDEQRKAIGAVWTGSQLAGQAGGLAQSKGKSDEVKKLGKWMADDERLVSQDLGKLLHDRKADPAALPPRPDRDRIQGELAEVAKASGDAFDRAFAEFLTRNAPSFAQAAGHARDVTPGTDADLKWYLDQIERSENGHRDAARQLSAQRQARTPAARPAGR